MKLDERMGSDLLLPLLCLLLLLLLGILQEGDFGSQFSQLSGLKETITRLLDTVTFGTWET